MKQAFLIGSLSLGILVDAEATTPVFPSNAERELGPQGFEVNKGQVRTMDGQSAPFVLYQLARPGLDIYLLQDRIAYQFTQRHYPAGHAEFGADRQGGTTKPQRMHDMDEHVGVETFRMDMVLDGANPSAGVTAEGVSEDYTNYYNRDALDVYHFTRITYHDVYPGIDHVVYLAGEGIKYDFVVRPGADPSVIRMRYEHHEELSIDAQGRLMHGNRLGRFIEEPPVSFQNGREVPTRFLKEGDVVRFVVDDYDHSAPLTIDPPRVWGTYFGGPSNEDAYSCAADASGNVFISGETNSITGIASGGHQNTIGGPGARDAFLVKYNSSGVRLWATYYGGEQPERAWCAVDLNGNSYLGGWTYSTSAIAFNGHQNVSGGGQEAFLAKFDQSGARLWATYYGGAGVDQGLGCATDQSGNVYLCGSTESSSGIASGGFQNTQGGGGDGFLVKFNSNGVRQWGTYYGGESWDEASAMCVDASGSPYLVGSTNSATGMNTGAQPFNGSQEAFVARFTSSGLRLFGRYLGGGSTEVARACAAASSNEVYVAGSTYSTSGFVSEGFQSTHGGGGTDAFLAKVNSTGMVVWSTYYGGSGIDHGYGCAVDPVGQVYLAGSTASTGMAAGGFQNVSGGDTEGFLAKFSATGARMWATYYGTSAAENARACATTAAGDVFLTGYTGSVSDPAIASNAQQGTSGGAADAFLAKLNGSDPTCTVSMKVMLAGPFATGTGLMGDNLRVAGLIPATDPYAALGYSHVNNTSGAIAPAVLSVTGSNAIVDWVVVELRDANNPVTRLITRSALLQRDGDVVDVDGVSPLFLASAPGNYYVAVRHRNHLGVMTASAQALTYLPTLVYFNVAAQAVYGTEPRTNAGSTWLLWSGDATGDGSLKYTGAGNDRDPILIAVGSTTPNNTVTGQYSRLDTNLDGVIKYTGSANDRDIILTNVGSTTPNNTRTQQLP